MGGTASEQKEAESGRHQLPPQLSLYTRRRPDGDGLRAPAHIELPAPQLSAPLNRALVINAFLGVKCSHRHRRHLVCIRFVFSAGGMDWCFRGSSVCSLRKRPHEFSGRHFYD